MSVEIPFVFDRVKCLLHASLHGVNFPRYKDRNSDDGIYSYNSSCISKLEAFDDTVISTSVLPVHCCWENPCRRAVDISTASPFGKVRLNTQATKAYHACSRWEVFRKGRHSVPKVNVIHFHIWWRLWCCSGPFGSDLPSFSWLWSAF